MMGITEPDFVFNVLFCSQSRNADFHRAIYDSGATQIVLAIDINTPNDKPHFSFENYKKKCVFCAGEWDIVGAGGF